MSEKNSQKNNSENFRRITEEMRESYLDYAMSVIVSRALPDIRDGLKPVQRRILYAMYEDGIRHNSKFRKSATVVGSAMGRYHPHGDAAVYDALVRMAQEFSLRYPLIEGQGNFGCFTGDTKVKLADGRNLSFKKLIKENREGKKNYTFTFNHQKKKIEIAEIKKPRKTKRSTELIEVTLDSGKKLRCTLDHRFMLRDGSYCEAQNLKEGDSLMPGYMRTSNRSDNSEIVGYPMIQQPFSGKWKFVHHLADKWNIKNGEYKKSAGRVRHHRDFNKENNNPENITRMGWKEHWDFHAQLTAWRHKNDPEYTRKLAKGRQKYIENNKDILSERAKRLNKKRWERKEFREKIIGQVKKMWQNPKYRERMGKLASEHLKKKWKEKEFQEFMSNLKSAEMKKRWQDLEYKRKQSQQMKRISNELWKSKEHREYMVRVMSEKAKDPNWLAERSRTSKLLWQDSGYRAKYPSNHFSKMARKLWEDSKTKEFHKEKAKKQWEDPVFRKKAISAARRGNKKYLQQHPNHMKRIAGKAAQSLRKNWQNPEYKKQVIKSKILRYVHSLLQKHKNVTPKLYENLRIQDGTPTLENALNYFNSFEEIVEKAKTYNHTVKSVRFIEGEEDVYDLTCEPWSNFLLSAGVFVHNSQDGDSPAAQRYTECRLSALGEEMLRDIEKNTVDFRPNYDGTKNEPVVLPSPIIELLLNGTVGIAVGMATKIPPHNLGEMMDACIHMVDNPHASTEDLFEFIQGPDFPTGGLIYGKKDIISSYSQGRGSVLMRGKAEIREQTKDKYSIIITEIPYEVNKAKLVQEIAKLVETEKTKDIRDIRDESDRKGLRIVVDLKKGALPKKLLSALYKYTNLQKKFHINMLSLTEGIQPKVLPLNNLIALYLKHKREVVVRRIKYDLEKARQRAHILEGLMTALDSIDEVIETIKSSQSRESAKKNLIKKFSLSDVQAQAILEMQLQRLAKLEREKIERELKELRKKIEELTKILESEKKLKGVIKKELKEMKDTYGDERKTKVMQGLPGKISEENLVSEEETVITLTREGYIKRAKPSTYKNQNRGGKGIRGMDIGEEDVAEHFLAANTLDKLLFFTNSGKVFQCVAWEIPEMSRTAKGRGIFNFLELSPSEKVLSPTSYSKDEAEESKYMAMVTARGRIKKTDLSSFKKVRRGGLIALKLEEGDQLRAARIVEEEDELFLISKKGKCIRFSQKELKPMGRNARGVTGMRLSKGDEIVGMNIIKKETGDSSYSLLVTEKGYGKRTPVKNYRLQSRGGAGIKVAEINQKTGDIVYTKILRGEEKEIFIISEKGQVIRVSISSIPELGRVASGVRIMKLRKNDRIASALCL